MRRPRFRKPQTEVSLFPFLAVLICTMGGLIVLLVLVVQQARVDARQIAESEQTREAASSDLDELQRELEDHAWRQELLEQKRQQTTEELAERRLKLGHLEEHLRELQERWRTLARQLKQAESRDERDEESLAERHEQLRRLREAIRDTEREVEETRRKLAETPRSYTIVPYQGPNGTRRRPIYLECTPAGVVIQPAGLLLPLADFQGPLGPGNPLDAALRAIREHWSQPNQAAGEPYPLLLVRPDGVEAYVGARAALKAWDDEFGYELVSGDMQLKFPPVDPTLGPLLEQTIVVARRRQQALAAAMPNRFEQRQATGFVAGPGGRFVPVGGASRSERGGGFGQRRISANGRGLGSGGGTGNEGTFGGAREHGGGPAGSAASAGAMAGREPTTNSSGTAGFYPSGGMSAASQPNTPARGPGDASELAGSDSYGNPNSSAVGRNDPRATAASGAAGGSQRPSGAARRGDERQASTAAGGSASGSAISGGVAGGTAAAGHSQPGRPGNLAGGSLMGAMADSRGANWALPRSTPGATGVTRPLRIDCYPDRLVIVPDAADKRPPRVVEFAESSAGGIDRFVSAVWEEMDHWGIALAGGYWKPVLQMRVARGAEQRYREVRALLEDSGLVVERKSP